MKEKIVQTLKLHQDLNQGTFFQSLYYTTSSTRFEPKTFSQRQYHILGLAIRNKMLVSNDQIPDFIFRGVTRICGVWGKKQKWCNLIFLFTYFCQKVDPLKTCVAKSDKPPKKDFTFHTRFNAQIQFKFTNHGHVIGPMSL